MVPRWRYAQGENPSRSAFLVLVSAASCFAANALVHGQSSAESQRYPSVFIAVTSRRVSSLKRNVIRDMWKNIQVRSPNVLVKFVVCSSEDGLDQRLQAERKLHGDLLFADCQEGWGQGKLTMKTLLTMMMYKSHFADRHELFMKVDDDTYVNWDKLAPILIRHNGKYAYMGVPVQDNSACRDASHRWYEPFYTWSNQTFPPTMASGAGYILGGEAVKAIVDGGIAERNMLWNEDRAVAVWVDRLQNKGVRMYYINIPGVRTHLNFDITYATEHHSKWSEYPHALHHGLSHHTVACLAKAEASRDAHYDIRPCFAIEASVMHDISWCTTAFMRVKTEQGEISVLAD